MEKIISQHVVSAAATPLPDTIDPILQRIYQHRGISCATELERDIAKLHPVAQLLGIDKAVSCLATALTQQQRILIIGDFDADGATSSALMMRALLSFGHKYVNYLVPNRFDYGYGLTPEIVDVAMQSKPDLIITVDNGISSIEGVAKAKQHGVCVVITDHHLPGEVLPAADAIVNPNQTGCLFPSKCLAGVGVAFYVMLALRRHLRTTGWFDEQHRAEPAMSPLLDLVALGTVADVVPLDHNNRILVHHGLRRIRQGQACSGILALLAIAKRDHKHIVSADLGFALGPRLNAAGRLDDMSIGIQCLLAPSLLVARQLAARLDQLNQQRKVIESTMQQQALDALAHVHLDSATLPMGLCLTDQSWHQGVIGIVASRLKERFHRPVIAFAEASATELKGSARSIANLHIRDCLSDIATLHPGLILKFGGHAMAAGLSIRKSDFVEFKQAFETYLDVHLHQDALQHHIKSDGELSNEHFSLSFASLLRDSGPWGQQFAEPLFDGKFYVIDCSLIGKQHLKLQLSTEREDEDNAVTALLFNINKLDFQPQIGDHIHIAYRLSINHFRGEESVQLVIEHVKPVDVLS